MLLRSISWNTMLKEIGDDLIYLLVMRRKFRDILTK